MERRDLWAILVIGAAVGVLSQTIIAGALGISLTLAMRAGIFLGFALFAPLALYILSLLGRKLPVLYQFGKFAAVGVLNTFVDIGVLNIEFLAFGVPAESAKLTYRAMKAASFLAATTNSFLWNKFWTFDSREPANPVQTIKFYAVAAGGFLLNVGLSSYVFSDIARPDAIPTKLWATIGALAGVAAAFLWNFTGYKFWVFKKKAGEA